MNKIGSEAVKLTFDEGGLDNIIEAMADRGLGESLENGLSVAAEYAQFLVSSEQTSTLSLGKLLHGVNLHWHEFEKEEGDTFWAWSVRATGKDLATIQRRVCSWEFLSGDYIPGVYKESIASFSTKMLAKAYVPFIKHKRNKYIGNYDFVERDFEIESKHWLKLSECADEAMVMELVREITGRTRSDALAIKIDDDGVLWAFRKGQSETIGQLFVDSPSSLVQDAIEELMNGKIITEFSDE